MSAVATQRKSQQRAEAPQTTGADPDTLNHRISDVSFPLAPLKIKLPPSKSGPQILPKEPREHTLAPQAANEWLDSVFEPMAPRK